jgi:biopolymer transport protein ExbD
VASRPLGDEDDSPMADINVVPLVDIILVVLIIFMVTAPMVLKPVIDVNLPKASAGEQAPEQPLNVGVTPDGQIKLNGAPVDLEQLKSQAQAALNQAPELAAVLNADQSVTLSQLTLVIDALKTAGIKRVAFAIERTQPVAR